MYVIYLLLDDMESMIDINLSLTTPHETFVDADDESFC